MADTKKRFKRFAWAGFESGRISEVEVDMGWGGFGTGDMLTVPAVFRTRAVLSSAPSAADRRASPPDLEGVREALSMVCGSAEKPPDVDYTTWLEDERSLLRAVAAKALDSLASLPNSPGGVGERERLEDERNVLMNSFGVSPFRDGLTRQRIEEIDRALVTAPTAEGKK